MSMAIIIPTVGYAALINAIRDLLGAAQIIRDALQGEFDMITTIPVPLYDKRWGRVALDLAANPTR